MLVWHDISLRITVACPLVVFCIWTYKLPLRPPRRCRGFYVCCAAAHVLLLWMLIPARHDLAARLMGLPSSSHAVRTVSLPLLSPCFVPSAWTSPPHRLLFRRLVFQAVVLGILSCICLTRTGGVAFIGTSLMIYVYDAGRGSLRSAASGPPLSGASSEKPFAGSPCGWVQSAAFAPSASCLGLATGVAPPQLAWTVPFEVSVQRHFTLSLAW